MKRRAENERCENHVPDKILRPLFVPGAFKIHYQRVNFTQAMTKHFAANSAQNECHIAAITIIRFIGGETINCYRIKYIFGFFLFHLALGGLKGFPTQLEIVRRPGAKVCLRVIHTPV